jgi:hypothetical protein
VVEVSGDVKDVVEAGIVDGSKDDVVGDTGETRVVDVSREGEDSVGDWVGVLVGVVDVPIEDMNMADGGKIRSRCRR